MNASYHQTGGREHTGLSAGPRWILCQLDYINADACNIRTSLCILCAGTKRYRRYIIACSSRLPQYNEALHCNAWGLYSAGIGDLFKGTKMEISRQPS